jgi:hypothetical protein
MTRFPRYAWLGLLLALQSATAMATTYRWVDAQGVVHYSDTPQPGAQVVDLPQAQTYRAPPVPAAGTAAGNGASSSSGAGSSSGASAGANAAANAYQVCALTAPDSEQSFYAPESVDVQVQLSPGLHAGDQLTVTMDGSALQPLAAGALQYRADQPSRGAHTLNVAVRDASGKILCSSGALTFYVQRPSLLSPLAPARGH